MGNSTSTSSSEQSAQAELTQNFGGACNLQCEDMASDISVDIIHSVVGGNVDLSQTCSTNGSCMINSMMDATSDVYFKAANSSNASDVAGLYPWSVFGSDTGTASSRQDISQNMNQSSSENCSIGSYNTLNDISILAVDSTIGGNIEVSQQGSVQGQCQLTNSMSAASYATGLADNTAQSGKQKKSGLFGELSTVALLVVYAIVGVIGIVIAFSLGKMIKDTLGGMGGTGSVGSPSGGNGWLPVQQMVNQAIRNQAASR